GGRRNGGASGPCLGAKAKTGHASNSQHFQGHAPRRERRRSRGGALRPRVSMLDQASRRHAQAKSSAFWRNAKMDHVKFGSWRPIIWPSSNCAFTLFAVPFATSIVTVLGSPKADPAQPRAFVGGHLVSTLVGLLVVKLCGPAPWAAAVASGLATVAMHLTGTFHPPAGIDPLVVVVNNMSWSFLIV